MRRGGGGAGGAAATGGDRLELELAGAGCSMNLIAMDGVYLDAVQSKSRVYLLAGARADVQITCSSAGTGPRPAPAPPALGVATRQGSLRFGSYRPAGSAYLLMARTPAARQAS